MRASAPVFAYILPRHQSSFLHALLTASASARESGVPQWACLNWFSAIGFGLTIRARPGRPGQTRQAATHGHAPVKALLMLNYPQKNQNCQLACFVARTHSGTPRPFPCRNGPQANLKGWSCPAPPPVRHPAHAGCRPQARLRKRDSLQGCPATVRGRSVPWPQGRTAYGLSLIHI